jgi:hypothetical protein
MSDDARWVRWERAYLTEPEPRDEDDEEEEESDAELP